MVKDYSGGCIAINSRRRKITRTRFSDFFSATKLAWKAVGTMLFVTLIVGITSTVWYGWQVQSALDQIGQDKKANYKLANENKLLIAQKNLMLTNDHMEKAARKIDLFSPSRNQLRYP